MSRFQNVDWDDLLKDSTPEQRLAIMGIEMVTPLATIKGFAQLLKMKLSEQDASERLEEFQEWAERILVAAKDLETLGIEISKASQNKK
jgi:nitrogen-specific signal transduction histidine kinase